VGAGTGPKDGVGIGVGVAIAEGAATSEVPDVIVVDNGSGPEQVAALEQVAANNHVGAPAVTILALPNNIGSAAGRNRMVDLALRRGAKYVLMLDNDVSIIPGSLAHMRGWLANNRQAYAIGADSMNCVPDERSPKIVRRLKAIGRTRVETLCCAPTQYGLFDARVLASYQFDEEFGIGWGGEDNDLGAAIEVGTGRHSEWFSACYLHRDRSGSRRQVAELGHDDEAILHQRYQLLLDKWDKPDARQNRHVDELVKWMQRAMQRRAAKC
jgi:glycosyltransferase involved in cell wall biosynthesis